MLIETASDTEAEREAADVLRAMLGERDLERFTYTNVVRVDEATARSHSHPVLTLHPRACATPMLALSTLVHEQMHWAFNVLPGTSALHDEVRARWPNPPSAEAGGATPASVWLHIGVCALELSAMAELVGPAAMREHAAGLRIYHWIYALLLGDEAPYAALLERHGVYLPGVPPTRRPVLDVLGDLDAFAADDAFVVEGLLTSWATSVDERALIAAVGDAAEPWRELDIERGLLALIVAITFLTHAALVERHGDATAARIGAAHPRNAEVYAKAPELATPVLDRIAQIDDIAAAIVRWCRRG